MKRTSLIGTQGYNFSLAATEPGLLEHGATESKVGYGFLKRLFMATVAATMFCTSAGAAICEGRIAAVGVHDDGLLLVRQGTLNSPIWVICSIHDGTGYEVNVATCKGWLAMLISAHKTGTTVHLYTRSTACNLHDWGTADMYFIEDRG
jgi:hypothetical protein